MAQRASIGLAGVKYAVLTDSTDVSGVTPPTYGTIYDLPGAISLGWEPGSSSSTLFADDGAYDTAETVGEMAVTLNVADITPENYARLLGHTYAGGSVAEKSTDSSPYIALMFKVLKSGKDAATAVYEYFTIYKIKLQKPSLTNNTKGSGIEFQTPTFEGKAVKLNYNDAYRLRCRTDDAAVAAAFLSGFFSAIPFQSADLTALTCTIAEGTAGNAGKIIATFAKASNASFSILVSSVTTSTFSCTLAAGGVVAGTFAVAVAGTTVAVTFTPTVAFSQADDVGVIIHGVKDHAGVENTITGDVITIA